MESALPEFPSGKKSSSLTRINLLKFNPHLVINMSESDLISPIITLRRSETTMSYAT